MSKINRWGAAVACVVIVVCAWVGVRAIFVEEQESVVPSLVGVGVVEAVDALQKQGLLAKIDKIDSPNPADTVVSQSLTAGDKVSRGKVVLLKVSKGSLFAVIPDVREIKFEEGIKKLSEAGFKVDKIIRVTDKLKPAGVIIAQNPSSPQNVQASRMVSLLVSTGTSGETSFVAVPDLSGQTSELAVQILEQIGLALGASYEKPSTTVADGTVLLTRPAKGAKVPYGAIVDITYARAPADGEIPSDTPPSNDQDRERAEAVKTIVVKEATPAPIPARVTPKSQETKPETAKKPEIPAKAEDTLKKPEVPAKSTEAVKKPEPAPALDVTPKPEQIDDSRKKTAKIRYQVPPLSKPMSLKIEMKDASGMRVLKDIMAQGGEYISMNAGYAAEATITIFLGGEFVWQDRFN